MLERAARECVAAEPDAANAARALLRRSRRDAALREAVLSFALVTSASERLRDPDSTAEDDTATPATGRSRAAAVLDLCRRLAPKPASPHRSRLKRMIHAEVAGHGDERRAVGAATARLEADPAAAAALAKDALEELAALEIAQLGLEEVG